MSRYTVEVLQRAVFEIGDIYSYILQDKPTVAQRVFDDIYKAIEDLAIFPHKGFPVNKVDKTMSGWKFFAVNPYLIFYKINGNVITVYHVLDGRRDYLEIINQN